MSHNLHENANLGNVEMEVDKESLKSYLCVCCLAENVPFIMLSKCSHLEYLTLFTGPEVNLEIQLICYQCHAMLKKIKIFKSQVQNSISIQNKQASYKILESINNNLEIHKTIDIHIPETTMQEEKLLTPDKTKDIPKTIDNDKKLKNIQTAMSIVNKNDESIKILASTLNILATNSLSQIATAFVAQSGIKRPQPMLSEQNSVEKELPVEKKSDRKLIETPSTLNIRVLKLTPSQLLADRCRRARSPAHLRLPYRCDHCVLAFQYRDNLSHHIHTRHTPRPGTSKCDICTQYVWTAQLRGHVARHYTRYKCTLCSRRFDSCSESELHYTREHTERHIKCKLCGFTTKLRSRFKSHVVTSHARSRGRRQ